MFTKRENLPAQIPCTICGNGEKNVIHVFYEKMFQMGDPFDYIDCSNCGAIH